MRERIFGHYPDIPVGTTFRNRIELSLSGMHPPRRWGINGAAQEGAESIVVAGAYEDDMDYGDEIIYTGQGGRHQQSGRQLIHQDMVRGNLALVKSFETGRPVRVIRGANPHSAHAPEEGYRYDGLYQVRQYWSEVGKSGWWIWRFRLVKVEEA
jgi:putative restriction endonuclease